MKRPQRATGATTPTKTDEKSIPDARLSPHDLLHKMGGRLIVSHCPSCQEPHRRKPSYLAIYAHNNLKKLVWYYLCNPCGRNVQSPDKAKRQRLADLVERNLESMGALAGLKHQGVKA
jgi:hypothetical protein